jgi:hypothetical protein
LHVTYPQTDGNDRATTPVTEGCDADERDLEAPALCPPIQKLPPPRVFSRGVLILILSSHAERLRIPTGRQARRTIAETTRNGFAIGGIQRMDRASYRKIPARASPG